MLPLSPNSLTPTAFFSLRYRQTTAQLHFNSFNCCKCLNLFSLYDVLSETPKQTPYLYQAPRCDKVVLVREV